MNDYETGTIVKVNRDYGFLKGNEGIDLHWHRSNITNDSSYLEIREGMRCRYLTRRDRQDRLRVSELQLEPDARPLTTRTGTIVKIIPGKYYGYIQPDDSRRSCFFHKMGTVDPQDFAELREGERVCFLEIADKQGRTRAIGVVRE